MLCLLGLLAYRGARRGLLRELAALVALVVAFLLAYRLNGPLGSWLAKTIHSLSAAEGRILAFLAILVLVSIGIDLAARLLTRVIKRIPLVGPLNRLGGLLVGALFALLAIWLLTTCLLVLPPFSATVSHSGTAHLLHSVTAHWSQSLEADLTRLTLGHLTPKGG